MTTYRPLRIAPDLPNSDDRFDDDTPPASPYQNKLPPKPRPSIRVGGFFRITLPRPQTIIAVGLVLLTIGWLFTPRVYKPRLMRPKHEPSMRYKNVDWRKYAYAMYATDIEHMCAALMVFDQLDTYGSKAERVLFYPQDWDSHPEHMPEHFNDLLSWAKMYYGALLSPAKVHGIRMANHENSDSGLHRFDVPESNGGQLDPSITKFLAISQTQFLRVIFLDSNISLRQHLDDLFLGPMARMALTRRYLTNPTTRHLSGHFFMVEPREEDAEFLFELAKNSIWHNDYFDSQVLTEEYGDHAMLLSHRRFGLNSVEFRREDHFDFLGNDWEEWNPERVLREASIVVFDEDSMPKPWITWPRGMSDNVLPHCSFEKGSENEIGCRNRRIWLDLYNDHQRRRKEVCHMLAIPGGTWKEKTKTEGSEDKQS